MHVVSPAVTDGWPTNTRPSNHGLPSCTATSKEDELEEIFEGSSVAFYHNWAMYEKLMAENQKKLEMEGKGESWTEYAARKVGSLYVSSAASTKVGIAVVESLKQTMRKSATDRRAVQKLLQKGAQQMVNMGSFFNAAGVRKSYRIAAKVAEAAGGVAALPQKAGITAAAASAAATKMQVLAGKVTNSDIFKKMLEGKVGIKDITKIPIVGGLSIYAKKAGEAAATHGNAIGLAIAYGPEMAKVVKSLYKVYTGNITASTAIVAVGEVAGKVAGGVAGATGGAWAGEKIGRLLGGNTGAGVGTILGGLVGSVLGADAGEYAFGSAIRKLLNVAPNDALESAYAYLGVQHDVSNTELNKAYRKLTLTHHPDKPEGSEEKWEVLNTHVEIIKVARACGRSAGKDDSKDEL